MITGEGCMDGQSIYGETPIDIAKQAGELGIPSIAIVGGIGNRVEEVFNNNTLSIMPITNRPMSLEYATEHVEELIISATERALRFINIVGCV